MEWSKIIMLCVYMDFIICSNTQKHIIQNYTFAILTFFSHQ